MPFIAIIAGSLLSLIGLAGFVVSGMTHVTALIPFFLGTLLELAGLLAHLRPGLRKHAMHGAATIALLGLLGSAGGVVKLANWALGTAPERPLAVAAQAGTAVVCVVFLVLAIRSFIAARRAREAAAVR